MQTGRYAGRAILNSLLDRPPLPPFVYSDKGNMATIGRTFAIMETAGIRLSGRMAKLAWAFLHIWYLMHNDDRLVVFLKWVWHFFTGTRGTCLIEGRKNYTG
jgi:NADH dehydrogenase